jgi:hypothetical protein
MIPIYQEKDMSGRYKAYRMTLFSCVLAVTAASTAYAQQGAAPPRPPASELVQVVVGESPIEQERGKRAHHNKTHVKKDLTRDDTLDAPDTDPANQGQGNQGQGNSGQAPSGQAN